MFYEIPVFDVEVLKLRDYETIGYLKSDNFYVGKESGNGFNTPASEGPKHKEKSHGYWKVILNLGYRMCTHPEHSGNQAVCLTLQKHGARKRAKYGISQPKS